MKLKNGLFFILLIFIAKLTFSQTNVSGKITNALGEPLENATILLKPTYQSTTSNAKGEFGFTNLTSQNYQITIMLLGFKTIEAPLNPEEQDGLLEFTLETDALNLQTVMVTGTFDPRLKLESTTSISLLSSESIQQTYPQGTAGLLQNIAGTFTDPSAGEVYTKVYTRGISASAEDDMGWYYVSLEEDGLPVSLVQHSYYSPDLFHRVDLMTNKVEAIRGGSAAITALNAPGGIYNFISHGPRSEFGGTFKISGGAQGDNNALYLIDGVIGGPIGNNWFYNAGGHYREDDGARDTDFTFGKGGQFKFNIIKSHNHGQVKFYAKILNDKTNRYTGVAATNWDNPTAAFGQDFKSTSLLMPSFDAKIPDGRNLGNNSTNDFNPTQGVHAKDLALGIYLLQDLGNNWSLKNNLRFSSKSANWQTSISNAFVSLSNPLAYFISGAQFPVGQVIFNEARSGSEVARVDNSGILSGNPFQYISGSLPNDAIMGTSAWFKDNTADEWMNQLIIHKITSNHDITAGMALGLSDTSHFTQGSFAFVTYEPNPRLLEVTLENPNQPEIALSDENGISNYGGLFFVNARANVSQVAGFINDRWSVSDKIHIDLGLRYESITHKGSKDRFAPFTQDGGLDGDATTAYDNGILSPTGERDTFDFNYDYISYSLGINYKIDKNTSLFSRLSKGNKAPELNYYFNNFSNVPINQPGAIQKIIQTEIGLKLDADRTSFTGTVFWSQLKDIGIANFEFDDSDNSIFYTPILFNTSNTIGFEWESVFNPLTNWFINFNGVIQDPKASDWNIYNASGTVDTGDDSITDYSGNVLPFNPKLMFNAGIDYDNTTFSGFFKWQYMGKRYGNVSNGFELDSYSIFNAGVGYKLSKNISANVVITNLFNSEGLANFFGANSFGANANGATPEFIAANPDASFVVFPVLRRRGLVSLNYDF